MGKRICDAQCLITRYSQVGIKRKSTHYTHSSMNWPVAHEHNMEGIISSCEGAALYVGLKKAPEGNFALKWRSIVLLLIVML
jgi:hypothetical protein